MSEPQENVNLAPNSVGCVGSRDIGSSDFDFCTNLAKEIVKAGFSISSGNAQGADQAFAGGGNSIDPSKVSLFLPKQGYNITAIHARNNVINTLEKEWFEIAERNHPVFNNLSYYVRCLLARNVGIVINSKCVVGFVNNKKSGGGGTGHTFRVASHLGVPTLKLNDCESVEKALEWVFSKN